MSKMPIVLFAKSIHNGKQSIWFILVLSVLRRTHHINENLFFVEKAFTKFQLILFFFCLPRMKKSFPLFFETSKINYKKTMMMALNEYKGGKGEGGLPHNK